jgi:hypothetical protein
MHMMMAPWLERIGDNPVDIGEAAAFIATGTAREFTDSSRGAEPPRARRESPRPGRSRGRGLGCPDVHA